MDFTWISHDFLWKKPMVFPKFTIHFAIIYHICPMNFPRFFKKKKETCFFPKIPVAETSCWSWISCSDCSAASSFRLTEHADWWCRSPRKRPKDETWSWGELTNHTIWLVVGGLNPSEKYESQLGWLATQKYGKLENVPNHQPEVVMIS